MSLMQDLIEPDEGLIRPTAARYANRYRMVDREDLAQELRLWWLTNQGAVKRYIERGEERRLTKSLQRHAQRYCEREKAERLGYRVEDLFFYDSGQVRDLLPMVWNPDLITQEQAQDKGQPRSGKPPNEGNNMLAMVADVARALTYLERTEYGVLWLHYGPVKAEYDEIAGLMAISGYHAAKQRVHRAVQEVVRQLGGESPWHGGPGSRRAMTNAAAQSLTSSQEDG